ncbi:hypothetical protein HanOQP8_Chr12g0463181 [Helianthus annuus]|nr:hypothetical protein HanOQP8_Chr12g0463181 [Helianthus annuus]
MYIKTKHFGATWHKFKPLLATWHFINPHPMNLSAKTIMLLHRVSYPFPFYLPQTLDVFDRRLNGASSPFPLHFIAGTRRITI